MGKRPKIGLALGSGAARGLAHIGVLKVLSREGIPIDYLAGSSMGSIIAVFYANKMDLNMMEKFFVHLKRKHWLDLSVPGLGFVIGDKIKEMVRLLTHRKEIQELFVPTAIVATDLRCGEPVIFRDGPISDAVRASISVPGIFEPVIINGRVLVDGGVIDRVPASVAKGMGADIVVGVDVLPEINKVKISNIFDVILQSLGIMERELLNYRMPTTDIVIQPDCADISPTTFDQAQECIRRGEVATEEKIELIKQRIRDWMGEQHAHI
ncbi:NTE family protein [Seinonella peptonophila]|uniref:NTE family protein n=1 Tax=Seinonella peptonophila TaxID=112248 RepID=A0A1M4UU67_9BACL|nr:patatin-like phospholipase family protein [Seinonella peptonophila]SHE60218.1 NTE family protein [Seinonella peptonophila]